MCPSLGSKCMPGPSSALQLGATYIKLVPMEAHTNVLVYGALYCWELESRLENLNLAKTTPCTFGSLGLAA